MPKLTPLTLADHEREKLEAWVRRPKSAQRLALRSRIILAAAAGKSNSEIADDLRITCQPSASGINASLRTASKAWQMNLGLGHPGERGPEAI